MLHQTIRDDIKTALRAKDTIRLEVLRGLNALITNEMISSPLSGEFLPDEKVIALIKRSAKQRKDSIEQFEKGGRMDLVEKEKAELSILSSYLPAMMTREEVKLIVHQRIETLKAAGTFDPKAAGKITGMIMKELAGKADGADVKAAVDDLAKAA